MHASHADCSSASGVSKKMLDVSRIEAKSRQIIAITQRSPITFKNIIVVIMGALKLVRCRRNRATASCAIDRNP
jgi:hypothetical protein